MYELKAMGVDSAALRALRGGVLAAAMFAGLGAQAGLVDVSGAFGFYTGAVQNGPGIGTVDIRTFINGVSVAPSEPLPNLEPFFVPADPQIPDSVGTGLGRGTVDLGGASGVEFYVTRLDDATGDTIIGATNLLLFTPGPTADVVVGQDFLLGTFTLQNGEFFAADPLHLFTFSLTTHSSDAALDGHVFADTIVLNITPNCLVQPDCLNAGYTPERNADFFYFDNLRELGSMSVYEAADSPAGANIGTIDLYGHIGSLDPTRFANPQGGVFIGPPVPPPDDVPSPGTLASLSAGLALLLARRRQQRLA